MNNKLTVSMLQTGGMSLVLTLKDRGFIIIDGGDEQVDYLKHSKMFMDFLKNNSPTEKITVLGWFFTHFHYDHVSLATRFLIENRDILDVKGFYINPFCEVGDDNDQLMRDNLFEAIKHYPDAKVHYLKTGEKLTFPFCYVDIFLSAEDDSPFGRINQNFVSAAFKVVFENGKSFLVTGDCDTGRLLRLLDSEDEVFRTDSELKCDVVQVAHHGLPMYHKPELFGNDEFMKKVDPTIALFPVDKERFKSDERFREPKWADNYYVMHSGATCYYSEEIVTVDMGRLTQ